MSQMTSKPNPSEFYDENLRATNPILDKFIYTKRRYTLYVVFLRGRFLSAICFSTASKASSNTVL